MSLGLPGTLPVLNKHAVELAIRVGLALSCQVQPSTFARKNYFYPDMPKNYQISQYEDPINANGHLELPSGRRIGIVRAHLEEDTGKSTHIGGGGRIHEAGYSLIDYNRAGVPLIEIVSAPDLRSSEEAKEYVSELRAILVAIGASDGKMEEGSLRVDANVSVRHQGAQQLGVRCEIKNVNSLRSLGRAIDYEAQRQVELLEAGGAIVQETRHWDEDDNSTHSCVPKRGRPITAIFWNLICCRWRQMRFGLKKSELRCLICQPRGDKNSWKLVGRVSLEGRVPRGQTPPLKGQVPLGQTLPERLWPLIPC